jgi:colanic acid/amylovoran biosynthesis protein
MGRQFTDLMRVYRRSDLIIAAGGGYLYTRSRFRGYIVLLKNLHSFLVGKLLSKPVYLYSQSIGPFQSRLQERLVSRVLRYVQLVETREDYSFRLVKSWEIDTRCYGSIDAAFLIPSPERSLLEYEHDGLQIGATARSWLESPSRQEAYIQAFSTFLDYLANEKEARIVFLPQVTYSKGSDDDRLIAREIRRRSRFKDSMLLVEDELDPVQLKSHCSQMDYFIGTRFHSCIYSLSMNVPTVAIAYQYKTIGIMDQLGLEDYVIPIEKIDAGSLMEVFENLVRNRVRIRETLPLHISVLRERAARNSQWIAEDFLSLRRGDS